MKSVNVHAVFAIPQDPKRGQLDNLAHNLAENLAADAALAVKCMRGILWVTFDCQGAMHEPSTPSTARSRATVHNGLRQGRGPRGNGGITWIRPHHVGASLFSIACQYTHAFACGQQQYIRVQSVVQ